VLSTIHSAKGMEWDTVYVLNVVDGSFPSEFSTGKPELIEEERRLLYVALTRAQNDLLLIVPLRFHLTHQPRQGGMRTWYGGRSRFMTEKVSQDARSGRLPRGAAPRRGMLCARAAPRSPWTWLRGCATCGEDYFRGFTNRSVKRSLSPMAAYLSRSLSPRR